MFLHISDNSSFYLYKVQEAEEIFNFEKCTTIRIIIRVVFSYIIFHYIQESFFFKNIYKIYFYTSSVAYSSIYVNNVNFR